MWSLICFALGYGSAHLTAARLASAWTWLESIYVRFTTKKAAA